MNDKRFQKKLEKKQKLFEQDKREKELVDEYADYIPEGPGKKISNIMLVVVVFAIVAYAVANFILQYFTGYEMSSTLTTCWYTFWGAEIFALAGIKVSKVWHEPSDDA